MIYASVLLKKMLKYKNRAKPLLYCFSLWWWWCKKNNVSDTRGLFALRCLGKAFQGICVAPMEL